MANGRAPRADELGDAHDRDRRLAPRCTKRTRSCSTRRPTRSGWPTRSRRCRPPIGSLPTVAGGTGTAPGTRSASSPRSHVDGRIESSCPDCGEPYAVEVATASADADSLAVPLPRAGRALVGRHRLHLKHDEPLPVGRAHRPLARRTRARRDDPGADVVRPRARVVGHARRTPTGGRARATRTRRSSTASGSSARSGFSRDACVTAALEQCRDPHGGRRCERHAEHPVPGRDDEPGRETLDERNAVGSRRPRARPQVAPATAVRPRDTAPHRQRASPPSSGSAPRARARRRVAHRRRTRSTQASRPRGTAHGWAARRSPRRYSRARRRAASSSRIVQTVPSPTLRRRRPRRLQAPRSPPTRCRDVTAIALRTLAESAPRSRSDCASPRVSVSGRTWRSPPRTARRRSQSPSSAGSSSAAARHRARPGRRAVRRAALL